MLRVLAAEPMGCELRISRPIVDEVWPNLTAHDARVFFRLIRHLTVIDEDWFVPDDVCAAYEAVGLKPSDASIAAYAEYVEADYLVSENRHFLSRRGNLRFRVVTAQEFLEILGGANDD
jgi:predicted nucleic acid-binding protein